MPRLTAHGEVVFEPYSRGKIEDNFWGDYHQYWPGTPEPNVSKPSCGTCGQPPAPPQHANIEAWFAAVQASPSDFHEHMPTLKRLAAGQDTVVELSTWLKPALLSLAAGRPKVLRSICPGVKPEWVTLKQLLTETDFAGLIGDSLGAKVVPSDLLFIDTFHKADRLLAELRRWAPVCRGRIVVHCTTTYGEKGDDGSPGVLVAIRKFVRENPQWSVIEHFPGNHGLTVLSLEPSDKKPLPSGLKMAWNYGKALATHIATGRKMLPLDQVEARLDVCATCDQRTNNRCSACGCYLDKGPKGEEGKAEWADSECPLGRWPLN